ncbi:MAG: GNAT family N-acetyltransferase [Armatimonadetes bacterium]|nr:GNAT family N-acetyltransferase [Armatimonadota bacterium]
MPPTSPPIRKARISDLPAIVRIYNQSVPDRNATCDLEPTTLQDRIPWFHSHGARFPLWVAAEKDIVKGWACISPYNEKPGYARMVENSLYIEQASRKQGWGSRLLAHTIKETQRLGYHTILARIFAHNPVSLELHLKHGFEEQGRLREVAYIDGEYLDVAYLIKILPEEK